MAMGTLPPISYLVASNRLSGQQPADVQSYDLAVGSNASPAGIDSGLVEIAFRLRFFKNRAGFILQRSMPKRSICRSGFNTQVGSKMSH